MSSATSRRLLLLAFASLPPFPFAVAQPAATTPGTTPASQAATAERISRFEQMLVRSPGPGRAFDEVFAHYFATEGVVALRDRWTAARDAATAATSGSSDAAAYALLLGQLAERIGDMDTARARYTEAAAATPKDFRPFHRLGRLEIRDNKLPAGIAALEKAAALDLPPTDAQDVLRDLARARSRVFDEAGALAAWKDLAARFPDDALVLEEVGQAQLDAAAYDEAIATFTALEKSAGGDAYRAVLARLRLGEVAARKGDREAALARFSAALDGTHRDSWLHREAQARVDALFREQGDFDGLVAFHEARLSGASRDPAAARRLADLLIELNRTDKALEWFDKATGWAPDDHALRFAHIRALLTAKRDTDALPLLETLVKRHPSQAAYREALGQLHWDRSKSESGMGILPMGSSGTGILPVGSNSTAVPPVGSSGMGILPMGSSSPAVPPTTTTAASSRALALETWAALAPANASVADLLALAELYRTRDLPEETRATLARALAAEPASYDLRERLALQLLAMKRGGEAWAVARNSPAGLADAAQYRRLATLEKRNSLLDESLASLDRGLTLAPDNYELLDLRWQVLTELTRWDDALALFPKLLAQAPGDYARDTVETRHLSALRSAEKLDATLAALAKRVADEDPSLTEADHRLHIRLILAQSIPLEAEAAFAAAKKRFPDSFSIAQLEADHLERTAPLADRTAALRRLAVLRPERAPEWLRRLVNTHRFDGDFDGARKVVAELVALAPADAHNHVLAAELEFDSGQPAAGLDALQRALRLASDPAPIRARLARALMDHGRPAAALALHEEAFYAAPDDNARRAFLTPMTEAAVHANDLDGLLTRFAERNRPRRDTAAYHIELGEIHFNAQDFPAAQESWNRALDLRRDDTRLLARLLDLARKNSDPVAIARLVRLRHELDPSPAHAIELAESLLETDANDEAMQLFLAHAAYFYTDTTLLPRLLPALVARDLADPLIERLRNEAAAAIDPLDRDFVLATAFITVGDFRRAESLLWSVYNTPPAPVAPPPAASSANPPPANNRQQLGWISVQQTAQGYQAAQQLLQSQNHVGLRSRHHFGFNPQNAPTNPTRVQDTALGYLGALAMHQDRADAFLARLETELENRRATASQRVHEFTKVQAREAALRHLEAALLEPSPDLTVLQMAPNLLREWDHQSGVAIPLSPDRQALLEAVHDAIEKHTPPQNELQKLMHRFGRLQQAKDHDAALALLVEFKALPNLTPAERAQVPTMELHLRIQANKWDDFLAVLSESVANEPQLFGDNVPHYITSYLNRPSAPRTHSAADLEAIARLLLDAYIKPAPASVAAQQRTLRLHGSSNAQHEIHMLLTHGAPLGGTRSGMEHQMQQLAPALRDHRETFLPRLLALGSERDADALRAARILVFRLALAYGDTALAESVGAELLTTQPEPGLVFNLAEIAFRDKKYDIARARYASLPAGTGSLAIAAQSRLVEIALLEKDTEAAKVAATTLVRLRPPSHLPNINLASVLTELGLDKTVKLPAPRVSSHNPRNTRNEETNRLSNELNTALNKNDFAAAESLARRILASSPLSEARRGNDYQRRNALGAFVRAGLMDAYLADLEAQLTRSPNSALVLELLAEAHGVIRQQTNNSNRVLSPVATSPAPLPLPVRIRLQRRGDTLIASHAPVLFSAPPDAGPTTDPTDTSLGYEPEWTQLGSVVIPDLTQPSPGLTARNQNFRNVSEGRFTDIHYGGRVVVPADFKNRETFTFNRTSVAFHPFDGAFDDGASIEFTLDTPATSKARVPSSRGIVVLESAERLPRVALVLNEDGTLAFSVRRHTGAQEIDYLARLVALRPRDEPLRTRYIESLFAQRRGDEAIAFLNLPDNENLLTRFSSNRNVVEHHRKAGTLDAFAARTAELAIARGTRPGQYPQIDYNVLQLARQLRDAKDVSAAVVIWEKVLPALRDHQAGEVRAEFTRTLLDAGDPESRARATEVVRDHFIAPPSPPQPRPSIFGDNRNHYSFQPWYASSGTSGFRIHTNSTSLLDTLDDPAFIRALIEENTPRLSAAAPGWEPRCYDLALRLRAGDPSAPVAFIALWTDALEAAKTPTGPGRRSGYNPINGFLLSCLERLVVWPDPDGKVEAVFRSVIAQSSSSTALTGVVSSSGLGPLLHNPWMRNSIQLSWTDYLLVHRGADAHRDGLVEFGESLASSNPQQTNHALVSQVFGRLLALGAVAEARALHDGALLRTRRMQGLHGNDPRLQHYTAMLDALEGKGDAPAPAIGAWITPAADGAPELRWEVTGRLAEDKENENPPRSRILGHALPRFRDGLYDLLIEFLPADKDTVLSSFTVPAAATRGRQRLDTPPVGTRFRATLLPREGSGLPGAVGAPQLFSAGPNLLTNPEARIQVPTTPDSRLEIPGWNLAIPAIAYAGGPALGGRVTQFITPPSGQNAERLTRSALIPIDPKEAYVISAWAARLPEEHGQLELEFVDATGKILTTNTLQGLHNHDLRWQRLVLCLGPGSRRELPQRTHIPDATVAVRLRINGQPALRLADLAIQRLPAPTRP